MSNTNLNSCMISGNLVKEPYYSAKTVPVLRFTVASGYQVPGPDGTWDEPESRADYVDCVMFGSRAAGVGKHLVKGQKVYVRGHVQNKQSGNALEVVVDEFEFGPKPKAKAAGPEAAHKAAASPSADDKSRAEEAAIANSASMAIEEGDIPF